MMPVLLTIGLLTAAAPAPKPVGDIVIPLPCAIRAIAFAPQGDKIVTVDENGTIRVIEFATGKELVRMKDDIGCDDVAMAPDGKKMATVGSQSVRVWNLKGEIEHEFPVSSSSTRSIQFLSGGKELILIDPLKGFTIFDVANAKIVKQVESLGCVRSAFFSSDEKVLVLKTGPADCILHTVDSKREVNPRRVDKPLIALVSENEALAVELQEDGRELSSVDLKSGKSTPKFVMPKSSWCRLSPDNTRLAQFEEERLQIREIATGRVVETIEPAPPSGSFRFAPDGRRIATITKGKLHLRTLPK